MADVTEIGSQRGNEVEPSQTLGGVVAALKVHACVLLVVSLQPVVGLAGSLPTPVRVPGVARRGLAPATQKGPDGMRHPGESRGPASDAGLDAGFRRHDGRDYRVVRGNPRIAVRTGVRLLESDAGAWVPAARTSLAAASEPETEGPRVAVTAEEEEHGSGRRLLWASLLSAGILGGAAANSFTDNPRGGFHITQEGWFGQSTYVGGADKVSHFVSFYIIARELPFVFEYLGYPARTARWMGFGVSSAAGLMIEIGDGTNQYGFSFEDLIMDVLGAGTAAVVSMTETDDLLGFRFGWVPGPGTPSCCRVKAIGRDYSREIYTMDLKLAGVVRRLGLPDGPVRYLAVPARYLLVSLTYGVKGYPYSEPEFRQRQLGFQVGLNLWEPLHEIGVRTTTWWGIVLDTLISNIQYPYTAVGYQYDLNHGKLHGPGIGNSFFPRQ